MTDVADTTMRAAVTASTPRYQGRVISVRTDRVRLPDGSEVERDVVETKGAVGVIALDDARRVLLVQQYRHPVASMLWEPPAGLLDRPGEPASAAAARELFEEAGYRASDWRVLVDGFASPGMTDEAYRVYLARDVREAPDKPAGHDEEKDMPVAWLDLDVAVSRVLAGELHNPMAVMGILALAAAERAGLDGLRPVIAPWPARPDHAG